MKNRGGTMKTSTFLLSFLFSLVILSTQADCSASGVTGVVGDAFSHTPISGATITAHMTTDIVEHKKYERISTVSNHNGSFTLRGLSPKYGYKILASKNGYFSMNGAESYCQPPEAGQTRILPGRLTLVKQIKTEGTVLNKFTSAPIAGAVVTAKATRPIRECPASQVFNATSDLKGTFAIGPLCPGYEYVVVAERAGYTYDNIMFSTRSEEHTSQLQSPLHL